MPTFNVPWDDGQTYQIDAASPQDAYQKVQSGAGTAITPQRPAPTMPSGQPALSAQPTPEPTGGTIYDPRPSSPPPPRRPLLAPAFDWAVDTALPAIGREGEKAVLPTIGALAGTVAPALVPPAAAVPTPVRQALGSAAGYMGNVATGQEPFSWTQLMASATPPGASQGIQKGLATIPAISRQARAAGLAQEAEALGPKLAAGVTPEATDTLFQQALQNNPRLPVNAVSDFLDQTIAREGSKEPTLQLKTLFGLAREMRDTIKAQAPDGGTPLAKMEQWRNGIGGLLRQTTNTQEQQELRNLYGLVLEDMRTAATTLGNEDARMLLQGIENASRMHSADDLSQMILDATGKKRPTDLQQPVDFGQVIRRIENPKTEPQILLSKFLERHPEEKAALLDQLEKMQQRNVKMIPPSGVMYGSGRAVGQAALGNLAQMGVQTVTGPLSPGLGASAMVAGNYALGKLLMTRAGRAALDQMIEPSGNLNMMHLLGLVGAEGARSTFGPPVLDLGARLSRELTGFPSLSLWPSSTPERR